MVGEESGGERTAMTYQQKKGVTCRLVNCSVCTGMGCSSEGGMGRELP